MGHNEKLHSLNFTARVFEKNFFKFYPASVLKLFLGHILFFSLFDGFLYSASVEIVFLGYFLLLSFVLEAIA